MTVEMPVLVGKPPFPERGSTTHCLAAINYDGLKRTENVSRVVTCW